MKKTKNRIEGRRTQYFLLSWENYREAGLADNFSLQEKCKDDGRNDKPNLTRLVLSDRAGLTQPAWFSE